jgi:hypothetical protein
MLDMKRKWKLLRIACGVVIVHLIMGVYQERILRQPYVIDRSNIVSHSAITNCSQEENSTLLIYPTNASEPEQERFTFTFSYVGVQCFVYTLVAKGQ